MSLRSPSAFARVPGDGRPPRREAPRIDIASLAAPPRRGLLVTGFLLLFVLVILGPLLSYSGEIATSDGNGPRQIGYVLVALIVLVGIRPLAAPRRLGAVAMPVAIALAICAVSILWSVAPGISIRRLILTALIIWTIFALVRNLDYETSLTMLRIALVLTLVANYVAVFGFPHVGIHQVNDPDDIKLVGNWRGVVKHKNFAGAISAVTALLFLFDAQRVPAWFRAAVIGAASVFVVFSSSRTSAGVGLAGIAVGFLYLRYDARHRAATLILLCIAAAAGAAWINIVSNPFTPVLSDPKSFTGRSYIWSTLLAYVRDHPYLGSGYGGFWNVGPASPIYEYGKSWLLSLASGHNGFLDLTVELGVAGMIAVVALTLGWALVRLVASPVPTRQQGALLIALLVFAIGHNMTETSLLERDIIVEVVLMFTIALIAQLCRNPARTGAGPSRAARRGGGRPRRATAFAGGAAIEGGPARRS